VGQTGEPLSCQKAEWWL